MRAPNFSHSPPTATSDCTRQCLSNVLYKLSGQSPISSTLHRGHTTLELVPEMQHNYHLSASFRHPEYNSRRTQQSPPSRARVANESAHIGGHLLPMGSPYHRSVCHAVQQSKPPFLFQGRNRKGINGGCLSHYMDVPPILRISSETPVE